MYRVTITLDYETLDEALEGLQDIRLFYDGEKDIWGQEGLFANAGNFMGYIQGELYEVPVQGQSHV